MKKIILTTLTMILGLISIASIAANSCPISASKHQFCQCFKTKFKNSCTNDFHMPPAMCNSIRMAKMQLGSMGTSAGCALKKQIDPGLNLATCKTTADHFLKTC